MINPQDVLRERAEKKEAEHLDAQDVLKERAKKKSAKQLKKEENVRIIESLILEKFLDISITTVLVTAYNGFFMIDDDITDIPFDEQSQTILYNYFHKEKGYFAVYIQLYNKEVGLEINVYD